jgi:hypothetical protein
MPHRADASSATTAPSTNTITARTIALIIFHLHFRISAFLNTQNLCRIHGHAIMLLFGVFFRYVGKQAGKMVQLLHLVAPFLHLRRTSLSRRGLYITEDEKTACPGKGRGG